MPRGVPGPQTGFVLRLLRRYPSEERRRVEGVARSRPEARVRGLESGDQEVLDLMNKGATVQDQIDSVVKANKAGIQTSVTVILGLGGRKRWRQHATATGKAAGRMNPPFSLRSR